MVDVAELLLFVDICVSLTDKDMIELTIPASSSSSAGPTLIHLFQATSGFTQEQNKMNLPSKTNGVWSNTYLINRTIWVVVE